MNFIVSETSFFVDKCMFYGNHERESEFGLFSTLLFTVDLQGFVEIIIFGGLYFNLSE